MRLYLDTNIITFLIKGQDDEIDRESVALYDLSGVMLSTTTASGGTATLNAGNASGVVIVKIGDEALKITLK